MRRRTNIAALLIVLLLCASALSAQAGNGLVVEVTDSEGQPLKYACVTVIPKEGEIIFQKADKRGRVKLKRIAQGSYRVVVKVDGYEAQKRQVAIGSTVETVAFTLQPRRVGEE
ncbi:MAG TPA: carboxypeptidase-like regulatory domain-containing protein [Pyrinomonadaceae bacterium]|nr:carboxypeptidase-like regulatory domain-containing protein [Pyrinomonadaceae bacterium]